MVKNLCGLFLLFSLPGWCNPLPIASLRFGDKLTDVVNISENDLLLQMKIGGREALDTFQEAKNLLVRALAYNYLDQKSISLWLGELARIENSARRIEPNKIFKQMGLKQKSDVSTFSSFSDDVLDPFYNKKLLRKKSYEKLKSLLVKFKTKKLSVDKTKNVLSKMYDIAEREALYFLTYDLLYETYGFPSFLQLIFGAIIDFHTTKLKEVFYEDAPPYRVRYVYSALRTVLSYQDKELAKKLEGLNQFEDKHLLTEKINNIIAEKGRYVFRLNWKEWAQGTIPFKVEPEDRDALTRYPWPATELVFQEKIQEETSLKMNDLYHYIKRLLRPLYLKDRRKSCLDKLIKLTQKARTGTGPLSSFERQITGKHEDERLYGHIDSKIDIYQADVRNIVIDPKKISAKDEIGKRKLASEYAKKIRLLFYKYYRAKVYFPLEKEIRTKKLAVKDAKLLFRRLMTNYIELLFKNLYEGKLMKWKTKSDASALSLSPVKSLDTNYTMDSKRIAKFRATPEDNPEKFQLQFALGREDDVVIEEPCLETSYQNLRKKRPIFVTCVISPREVISEFTMPIDHLYVQEELERKKYRASAIEFFTKIFKQNKFGVALYNFGEGPGYRFVPPALRESYVQNKRKSEFFTLNEKVSLIHYFFATESRKIFTGLFLSTDGPAAPSLYARAMGH